MNNHYHKKSLCEIIVANDNQAFQSEMGSPKKESGFDSHKPIFTLSLWCRETPNVLRLMHYFSKKIRSFRVQELPDLNPKPLY